MRAVLIALVGIMFLGASQAMAVPTVFNLVFSGAAEVPDAGDPDATGSGTITFDPDAAESPIYGSYSYNITFSNLAEPLTDAHVHTGAVGVAGPPLIGMGTSTTGGSGTLIQSWNDANWNGQWNKVEINQILANPSGFYVNLHNSAFPNGGLRAQLPEPASLSLVLVGGLALFRRTRA